MNTARKITTAVLQQLRATQRVATALLLPRACFACDAPLENAEAELALCKDCAADLKLFTGPCCVRCATPLVLVADRSLPCTHCQKQRWRFDEAIAAGEYDGLLRHLVLRAKHATEEAVSLSLGELIWRQTAERLQAIQPDVVTTIPMHWRRRLVRQTNSPELIGEVIAARLVCRFAPRLLRRVRATRQQTTLARSQRLPNVRRAMKLRRGNRIKGTTIVLIDDILTTGATCSDAARSLKRAGAARVVVVVAAKSL